MDVNNIRLLIFLLCQGGDFGLVGDAEDAR